MAAATALKLKPKHTEEIVPPTVSFGTIADEFFAAPVVEKPVFVAPKRSWLGRLADKIGKKIDRGMETLGKILDYVVPTGSMAALAVVGNLGLSTISNAEQVPSASETSRSTVVVKTVNSPSISFSLGKAGVEMPSEEKSVEKISNSPRSLWAITPEPSALNTLLLEKNREIVHHAGGVKANYLFDTAAHARFTKQLESFGGFSAILAHPEVVKAKNIAEMVNLVDRYFGEKVADLVESNAAALHLSSNAIATISR